MTSFAHAPQQALSPAELASLLPSRPLLSSTAHGWRNVVLQRYQHPPGIVSVPPVRDHLLTLHLAGPTLIEEERGGGRRERRWSDSGHVSLTPAGLPVSRSLKGRPDVLLIHVAPALVDEVVVDAYGLDPAGVSLVERLALPDETLDRLGRLLLAEAEFHAPGTCLVADTLARALAVHLLRFHSSLAPRAPNASGAMAGGRLRRVIEYMQAHLDEALPLAQLAALGGLSPSHFTRAFREATGEPPYRYLVRLRVERARGLLEHTALPIIEIGFRCGFEQPNHFATMFRKVTGMSPRAYRAARKL